MAEGSGLKRDEDGPAPKGGLRFLLARRPELLLSPLILVFVLLGWQYGMRAFAVPSYLIPPVSDVLVALYRGLDEGLLSRVG